MLKVVLFIYCVFGMMNAISIYAGHPTAYKMAYQVYAQSQTVANGNDGFGVMFTGLTRVNFEHDTEGILRGIIVETNGLTETHVCGYALGAGTNTHNPGAFDAYEDYFTITHISIGANPDGIKGVHWMLHKADNTFSYSDAYYPIQGNTENVYGVITWNGKRIVGMQCSPSASDYVTILGVWYLE